MFPELSKLLNQEDAPGVPCLDTVILALRSIRYFEITLRLATPDIRLASADAFAVVGGGCAGRAHGCKAKQGSRGKDGSDVVSSPTVVRFWGWCRERVNNSLVTAIERLLVKRI